MLGNYFLTYCDMMQMWFYSDNGGFVCVKHRQIDQLMRWQESEWKVLNWLCREDDDDKSDNSDENDTFALTNRQKELERRKMEETILAAAEGRFLCTLWNRI